ncbi:transporter [Garciella nitratireducens]|uniref:transporter n=1 Tax=Garciella nitratireducens TaxID=218205 RepID=UPI001BD4A539|nr:transporter [Garciella nitratireducens]
MLEKLRKINANFVNWIEFSISIIIMISILIEGWYLIGEILKMPFSQNVNVYFTTFLGNALNLVIGLEFLKMLNGHDPSLVIDVLIYTIARSLVVQHPNHFGILVGVLSIAVLFGVRKFLMGNWELE